MNETGRPTTAVVLGYQTPPVLDYRSRPMVRRKGIGEYIVEFIVGLTMVFLLIFAMLGIVIAFAALFGAFA